MPQDAAVYWMTPRSVRDPSAFPWDYYRAVVTYNVLFGGPLVIADGVLLTDLSLRDALHRRDPFVCGLVEAEYLRPAVRTVQGRAVPLREVSASIRRGGGHAPYLAAERDDAGTEFEYLETHASCVPYTLDAASGYYRDQMLRVLESVEFRETDLPPLVADAVARTVRDMVAEGHPLAWSSFKGGSELWRRLERQTGEDLWPRFGAFLDSIARGPYVTFLPHALGLSSVFSAEDRLGVEIWRGRYELTQEQLAARTFRRPRLSLADYVAGLAALEVDDIRALRGSAALQAYERACDDFSRGALHGTTPLDALIEYRREVDYAILGALRRRADDTRPDECSVSLLSRGGSEVGSWLRFGIKTAVDTLLLGGALGPLEFCYSRLQKRLGRDEVSDAEANARAAAARDENDRERMIHALQRQDSPTVSGETIVDRPTIRDLLTTVDPAR